MPIDCDLSYCDVCVPRGCSCNFIINEDCEFICNEDNDDFVQEKDDLGRLLSCVEFDYFEHGIDEEIWHASCNGMVPIE
jgi:hypothetical protein